MTMRELFSALLVAAGMVAAPLLASAAAGDWTNLGGNAGRNGSSDAVGPQFADPRWSGGRSTLISWNPVTEGDRVFLVRQPKWPWQQPDDAFVVAMDLATGAELWTEVLPYNADEWIPWIAGARDGRVYASRSGNGASVSARMLALDAADGDMVWQSAALQDAGAYDGVVFAPDGDLLVASFQDIWRLDAADGHTVWHAVRTGSVSGSCGGALSGNAFYVADAAVGGHVIVRYDATTGARRYQGPVMPGFTLQHSPMAGPDGTVYLNRSQNNPSVDFFYAFTDNGAGFTEKWHIACYAGVPAEFGVGPDGSVYMIGPGPRLARLDPATGAVTNQTAVLAGFSAAHIAVDAQGTVFLSNGGAASGRLYAYEADLTPLWNVAVPNINIGGPSLAHDGTLLVCGAGTDVRAYRGAATSVAAYGEGGILAEAASGGQALCSPNPFRTATTIRWRAPAAAAVTAAIYDVRGERVRTLLAGESRRAGELTLAWDGRDDRGQTVAPGLYLARVEAGSATQTARIVFAR